MWVVSALNSAAAMNSAVASQEARCELKRHRPHIVAVDGDLSPGPLLPVPSSAPQSLVPLASAAETHEQANELRPGARVRVEGTRLEDHHGKLGVLLNFFMESQRWGVRLDDGQELQVRPESLIVEVDITSWIADNRHSGKAETLCAGKPLGPNAIDGASFSYELLARRDEQHCEAFAEVWGSMWPARKKIDGAMGVVRRLRTVNGNHDKKEGMSHHGLREIAIYGQLGMNSSCVELVEAFAWPNSSSHPMLHLVYAFVEHDLVTYMKTHSPNALAIQSLLRQLLQAVNHLHTRSIVHRNIKSQTVLVSHDGELALAGLCTAAMACPSSSCTPVTERERGYRCTTWSTRAPELLLGPWRYGSAQDIWSCGMLLAQLCCCKGFDEQGMQASPLSDDMEMSFLLSIFARLGTPGGQHPLTTLPLWRRYVAGNFRRWKRQGWTEALPLMGENGVSLFDALTDLDACCRLCSRSALAHKYFLRPPPGHEIIEVFGSGEDFIHAFCATGLEEWQPGMADNCESIENCEDHEPCPLIWDGPGFFDFDALDRAHTRVRFITEVEIEMDPRPTETLPLSTTKLPVCAVKPDAFVFDDSWSSLRHRAFDHYLELDLKREKMEQLHRLTCIHAIHAGLSHCGVYVPALCQHIYGFIFRAKCPLHDCMYPFAEDIHMNMRAILNDWLTEVAWKYRLEDPALFFAVELADAYLRREPKLLRKHYQLVGVCSLLIAAKVIGTDSPEPTDMAYICDRAYEEEEVRAMEVKLVPLVSGVWTGWGPFHFLMHYTTVLGLPQRHIHVATMCLERSLVSYSCSRHAPSLIAAGACVAAASLLEPESLEVWDMHCACVVQLCALSDRSFDRIARVAAEIRESFARKVTVKGNVTELDGVRKKYCTTQYLHVASIVFGDKTSP